MSGEVKLTPEQIAEDFCSANPGKMISVGGITRDAAGVVRGSTDWIQGTTTGRMTNSTPNMEEIPRVFKSARRVIYVSNNTNGEICPECGQSLVDAPGGGIKCPDKRCGYWFCF